MCGIAGYTGCRPCTPLLLSCLSRLEYRGYDSAGIAVIERSGIRIAKKRGRLVVLSQTLRESGFPDGCCGIGHTRWATHGEPSDINAHPHRNGRVAVVHNGIIENEGALRAHLMGQGRAFVSETDTEVISHLIDSLYRGDPVACLSQAAGLLRGSWALGVLFADHPGTIYALRWESPLIIGLSEQGSFIASDIPAILPETRRVLLLENGDIAAVSPDGAAVFDRFGAPAQRAIQTVDWDMSAAERGGWPHFMLKEIHEQPRALADTLLPRLAGGWRGIFGPEELRLPQEIACVRFVACGSAYHAGLLGRQMVERLAGIPAEAHIASEFRYHPPVSRPGELCVCISQSGETADTLAALRLARERGVYTLAVVNVRGSSIAREADAVLHTHAGPEIAVATTKAYSAQAALLHLLAVYLAARRGALSDEDARGAMEALRAAPEVSRQALEQEAQCKYLASLYQGSADLYFMGRGQDDSLCREGSLKLKEISYIHSEACPAGELKHGTISLVTPGVPVLALATEPALYPKILSNIREVRARGASVLLLSAMAETPGREFCDYFLRLPPLPPLTAPFAAIVPLHLFAYYTAVLRGCDPDRPRNLAKSVTVE